MDTTEEIGGTYFYHGHANVTHHELFWLIFLESFADYTELEIETAATILAGQPLLPKKKGLGGSTKRTSIASKLSRRIFKDMRLPNNMRLETMVGNGKVRYTNKVGALVGRYVPLVGYAQAFITMVLVSKRTQKKYNLIARPEHRIQWVSF